MAVVTLNPLDPLKPIAVVLGGEPGLGILGHVLGDTAETVDATKRFAKDITNRKTAIQAQALKAFRVMTTTNEKVAKADEKIAKATSLDDQRAAQTQKARAAQARQEAANVAVTLRARLTRVEGAEKIANVAAKVAETSPSQANVIAAKAEDVLSVPLHIDVPNPNALTAAAVISPVQSVLMRHVPNVAPAVLIAAQGPITSRESDMIASQFIDPESQAARNDAWDEIKTIVTAMDPLSPNSEVELDDEGSYEEEDWTRYGIDGLGNFLDDAKAKVDAAVQAAKSAANSVVPGTFATPAAPETPSAPATSNDANDYADDYATFKMMDNEAQKYIAAATQDEQLKAGCANGSVNPAMCGCTSGPPGPQKGHRKW